MLLLRPFEVGEVAVRVAEARNFLTIEAEAVTVAALLAGRKSGEIEREESVAPCAIIDREGGREKSTGIGGTGVKSYALSPLSCFFHSQSAE